MKTPIPKSVPVGLHASSAIGNDIMSSSSPPGVVLSCFEVVLRNRIDAVVKPHLGKDWLRDLILPGGAWYNDRRLEKTRKIIENAYNGLVKNGTYSNSKLLSEMEFGVWKHMFSNVQYRLSGRKLMGIFPNKPKGNLSRLPFGFSCINR